MRTSACLVKENGRWEGTARALLAEVLKRGEGCDATSAQDVGKRIAENQGMLREVDKIVYIHASGGRQGRGYIFMRIISFNSSIKLSNSEKQKQ